MLKKKAYHLHLLQIVAEMVDRELSSKESNQTQELFMKQATFLPEIGPENKELYQ